MSSFDVAVLGGGPGGYVAAIRAAQLGARTAIVERDRLGGTCLVRGCIPTKALLQSAELYSLLHNQGAEFGLKTSDLSFDLPAAQKRRVDIVNKLVKGVEALLRGNRVEIISGHAQLGKNGQFAVGDQSYTAQDTIIATGSVVSQIPLPGAELTINSDQVLELQRVPESMIVIGGGVVGIEWGALYAALGTKVTVLEALPQILPMVEEELARTYRRHFEKVGGVIHTQAKVQAIYPLPSPPRKGEGKQRQVSFILDNEEQQAQAEVVLMAVGRRPATENLGLENAGIEVERGRVVVDQQLRCSQPGIWAIGDVIGGIMLAHVASYEGVCAAENIGVSRNGAHLRQPDYHAAPNCIYTDPEIAHVGLSEQAAREKGHQVKVGRFPLAASGRALTLGQAEGTVKVIADAQSGVILGVHMVGPRVTDVIAEATLAVQQRLRLADLELTMHAHPTLAESFLEAGLAAEGRAIHSKPSTGGGLSTPSLPLSARGRDNPEESTVAIKQPPAQPPQAELFVSGLSTEPSKIKISKTYRDDLLYLYKTMLLIRRFEERAKQEYTRANIGGYCHLNLGEEASVVGSVLALRASDYFYTSYREHGQALVRGISAKAVMAELFGRETGTSHGRGGSMHLFDSKLRFMGGYGIVGGQLPLAVGAALSIRYRQEILGEKPSKGQDITFCTFGDGANNIGAFHESLNLAKVLHLPVVWFCVNNQYGMGTSVDHSSAVPEIYKRACAYNMESIRIDGTSVMEVLQKTSEVVEKTRQDSQPRLIEAVSYRFAGHSVVDPDKYRTEQEKAEGRKTDPLQRFEEQLIANKVASSADLAGLEKAVLAEIEEAVEFAAASPNPPVEELYRHLYAESK